MSARSRFPWIVVLALASTTMWGTLVTSPPVTAAAQVGGGTGIALRSSNGTTIAWAARCGDGTKEFWAYVQGEFEFASSSHTASNPWTLDGVYDSGLPTGCFDVFRTEVLSRPAAQGKTIIFHNMTVAESVTAN